MRIKNLKQLKRLGKYFACLMLDNTLWFCEEPLVLLQIGGKTFIKFRNVYISGVNEDNKQIYRKVGENLFLAFDSVVMFYVRQTGLQPIQQEQEVKVYVEGKATE